MEIRNIIGLFGIVSLTAFLYLQWPNKQAPSEHITAEQNEFIFSAQELSEISKWKHKSMDDMALDAMTGDSAALYMLGLCMLTGNGGWTIDTENANMLLTRSASLGFAPAVNQMRFIYDEAQNHALGMVYLNLTISLGHQELRAAYTHLHKQLVDDGGLKIAQEIEKIAAHKASCIAKNKEKMQNSSNPGATIIIEVQNLDAVRFLVVIGVP